MPSKRDNDEERFNRIAALMEEYRVNHEDLVHYVNAVRQRAAAGNTRADGNVKAARRNAETRRVQTASARGSTEGRRR